MQLTVLLTSPDEPARVVTLEDTLEALKGAIGGGYLEAIGRPGWSAYLDEEGRLKGLPVNTDGTRLAQALGFREGPPWDDIGLVGPVLFIGPADRNGNETSVTDEVIGTAIRLEILRAP